MELKVYKMVDKDYCDDSFCIEPSDVYIKSEADEVICHQKYKRCLAMSKLCRSEWAAAIFIPEKCMGEKHAKRYMRWEHRWLKLAEQFKTPEWKLFFKEAR